MQITQLKSHDSEYNHRVQLQLKVHELLNSTKPCSRCGNHMREVHSDSVSDGVVLSCPRPCRTEKSIREGTWFESSKLSLDQIVDFTYYWAFEATVKYLQHKCRTSSEVIVN